MENLPFVVLEKLFAMMPDLNARIKCSHICKNWREAYEAMPKSDTLCLLPVPRSEFVPLNHRLFYSNERVFKFSFLRIAPSKDYLQFLESNASALFRNIKTLVVFCYQDEEVELCFQKQLNGFKCLEYAEICCTNLASEDCEIDLPKLEILAFNGVCSSGKQAQILLRTPSLKALRISENFKHPIGIANFKFLFPQSLVYLEISIYEPGFKFRDEFANLECLVLHYRGMFQVPILLDQNEEMWAAKRLLDVDFLKSLPNLKLFFFDSDTESLDLAELGAEKERFGMKNLQIVYEDEIARENFNYRNSRHYAQHKQLLKNWPGGNFNLVFDKLIKCKVPLDLFKENYLNICELKVRQVADQSLLVDLLSSVRTVILVLQHDCNLGQSFFNEIVDSVTLKELNLNGYDWSRLTDPSVLSRLNVHRFVVNYRHFLPNVVRAVLSNRTTFTFGFYKFEELMDAFGEEDSEDGEPRQEPNEIPKFCHCLLRAGNAFNCRSCGWTSSNDRNGDPIGATVHHIENERVVTDHWSAIRSLN